MDLSTRRLLEPCAVRVARTVLRGGKSEKIYLSRLGQRVNLRSLLKPIGVGIATASPQWA